MQPVYRRILLKLSGEAFSGPLNAMENVVDTVSGIVSGGVQVAIVIGGGNILRGASLKGVDRVEADTAGMLATCINGILLRTSLRKSGLDPVLMVPPPAPGWAENAYASDAKKHLSEGNPVIFAGGTGNPLFTTDTAAVLRAIEIGAAVLLKGTKVDGVYDSDPVRNESARFFPELTHNEALTRNLKIMDSTAFSLAAEHDLPIIVFDFSKKNAVFRILEGERIGTLIQKEKTDDSRNL